jgi:hypothetical protein
MYILNVFMSHFHVHYISSQLYYLLIVPSVNCFLHVHGSIFYTLLCRLIVTDILA